MLNSSVREAFETSVQCDAAAGQLPDQPAVDGAEQQLAGFGALLRAGHAVQQPADLGAREVRVDQQARCARETAARGRRP